jgi:hypothetical protein
MVIAVDTVQGDQSPLTATATVITADTAVVIMVVDVMAVV